MNIKINLMLGVLFLITSKTYAQKPAPITAVTHAKPTVIADSTKIQSKGNFSFTTDFSNATVVGSGSHRYRMVLLDPKTNKPLIHQDYALSHEQVDLTFVKNDKKSVSRHNRCPRSYGCFCI